jgi:hypothetical protein
MNSVETMHADTTYNAVYIGIKNERLANKASPQVGPSKMDEQTIKFVVDALLATK